MRNLAKLGFVAYVAAIVGLSSALPCVGDDVAQTGRAAVEKWQAAIVTIRISAKTTTSYEGQEGGTRESKSEITGVIIDSSGLVAASLSATNPEEAFQDMMGGGSEGSFKYSSELTDVKMLLPDGQELPASVVLRDKDLDLAFFRPKTKLDKPAASVDLTKAAKPALLDQVVVLHRLGTVASRAIAACVDRVQAVVDKPRTYYVPGAESMNASAGAAVFSTDASPIGLLLVRSRPQSAGQDYNWFGGMSGTGLTYVIIPAADIAEAAKQAPETAEAK